MWGENFRAIIMSSYDHPSCVLLRRGSGSQGFRDFRLFWLLDRPTFLILVSLRNR